jgi:uncharacterized protein (TIGR00251 family)
LTDASARRATAAPEGAADQPWRQQGTAILIDLKVVPNARSDAIAGVVHGSDGRPRLQLRIKAPPVDGKANAAVLELLARRLGCPRSALAVTAGAKARQKRVRWEVAPDDATVLLAALAAPASDR